MGYFVPPKKIQIKRLQSEKREIAWGVRGCKVEGKTLDKDLFAEITELTGLPEEVIGEELKRLLEMKGIAPQELTMESLRAALSDYLAEISLQMDEEAAQDSVSANPSLAKLPAQ